MKAFLLVGGLGTRLKPITDEIPKCLVEIYGKTLIEWWLDALIVAGISEVLINLHHFPNKVREYVNFLNKPINVIFFHEEKLLGSAGTIRENRKFIRNEQAFLVVYGDNLTSVDLRKFINFHLTQSNPVSIALFITSRPSQCGIVRLDDENVVTDFEEKPVNPKSSLANAGMYLFDPLVIDKIPVKPLADIGYDLLPQFINKMSGWVINDYLIDIGTHENLIMARKDWPSVLERMQRL